MLNENYVSKIVSWIEDRSPTCWSDGALSQETIGFLLLIMERVVRAYFISRQDGTLFSTMANGQKIPQFVVQPSVAAVAARAGIDAILEDTKMPARVTPTLWGLSTLTGAAAAAATPNASLLENPRHAALLLEANSTLDLSPKVVQILQNVITDLVVQLEHHQQEGQPPYSLAGTSKTAPMTAVELVGMCLQLFQYSKSDDDHDHDERSLYQTLVPDSSEMEKKSFDAFCIRTLQSAQAQTILTVEAYHDFQLLWNNLIQPPAQATVGGLAQQQHQISFLILPHFYYNLFKEDQAGGEDEQPDDQTPILAMQDLAWKLTCWRIWQCSQKQKDLPSFLSRRYRLLAAATSLGFLAILPILSLPTEDNDVVDTHHPSDAPGLLAPSKKRQRTTRDDDYYYSSNSSGNTNISHLMESLQNAAAKVCSFLTWRSLEVVERNISIEELRKEIFTMTLSMANHGLEIGIIPVVSFRQQLEIYSHQKTAANPKPLNGQSRAASTTAASSSFSSTWREDLQKAILSPSIVQTKLLTIVDSLVDQLVLERSLIGKASFDTVPFLFEHEKNFMLPPHKDLIPFLAPISHHPSSSEKEVAVVPDSSNHLPVAPPTKKVSSIMAQMLEYEIQSESPPIITDEMELQEWAVAVFSSSIMRPTKGLVKTLDSTVGSSSWNDTIIPVLNRALMRISSPSSDTVTVGHDGLIEVKERTQDAQFCTRLVVFYYHALDSILLSESTRLERDDHPNLVLSTAFHKALLVCCYTCILKAESTIMPFHKRQSGINIYSILQLTESSPYTYLKVAESFQRALCTTTNEAQSEEEYQQQHLLFHSQRRDTHLPTRLPRLIQKEIKEAEVHVVESLIWSQDASLCTEGSLVQSISKLKSKGAWPPAFLQPAMPEEIEDVNSGLGKAAIPGATNEGASQDNESRFLSFVLNKLLKISYIRVQCICRMLQIPSECPVAVQVWVAFRYFLRHHIDLLYDRHVDQWILCTIYGVCKRLQCEPDITFTRILEVYCTIRDVDIGHETCQYIVRHVKLDDDGSMPRGSHRTDEKTVNVIGLYNLLFVPTMKNYLLKSPSLRRNMTLMQSRAWNRRQEQKEEEGDDEANRVIVSEGNISLQLKIEPHGQRNDHLDQMHQHDLMPFPMEPQYRTFLRFGRAAQTNLMLANEIAALNGSM